MDRPPAKSLIACPKCNLEIRLLKIEAESDLRDLFTFECSKCGALEIRGVLVGAEIKGTGGWRDRAKSQEGRD